MALVKDIAESETLKSRIRFTIKIRVIISIVWISSIGWIKIRIIISHFYYHHLGD